MIRNHVSRIRTPNLPFEEWATSFRSERLTGALRDRLTHHVHIMEMNGDSYRLKQPKGRRRKAPPAGEAINPDTGCNWLDFAPSRWMDHIGWKLLRR